MNYQNYANYPRMSQSSGNGGKIIAAVVALALIVSLVAFFAFGRQQTVQTPQTSLQDTIASLQTQLAAATAQTSPPVTPAPLCPENYNPVIDINGKVYKNVCYAQSVGAQFAPTPYTGTGTVTDPVAVEILKNLPRAQGSRTVLTPGTTGSGQAVPNIHDAMAQAFSKTQAQRPTQTRPAYSTGGLVPVSRPAYA